MSIGTRRRLLRAGGIVGGALFLLGGESSRATAQPGPAASTGPTILGRPLPDTGYIIHGDGGDTTALWQEAFAGIARAGRGFVRATGEHTISEGLELPHATSLLISGDGDAVLRKGKAGRAFRLFSQDQPQAALPILVVRDIRLIGDWDEVTSDGGDDTRCLAVSGYHRVVIRNVAGEGFRNMTFTAGDCDEVEIDACRVLRCARDAINLSGSRFVKVTNCTIQNAWDDAIAVHVPRNVTDVNRRYATIISNNQILQANGIKVLGGHDITITGNQLIAPHNYGVLLGWDPYWREGAVPHANVIIADNIISEMISHDYLPGQGRIGVGICFADAGRKISSTRVTGNIITKYKPSGAGVHYSDWGFGPHSGEHRMLTADGWKDPELIHGHMGKGIGIRITASNADDVNEIAVNGNTFANLAADVERRVER
ncbi:MAG: right-handed parallel beta-helix repeat-containing protein [Rhodospirillales bacterium]|nr:right-handed parallel beta-helix repeat-containing protein [Rhodospirillales bacterium]